MFLTVLTESNISVAFQSHHSRIIVSRITVASQSCQTHYSEVHNIYQVLLMYALTQTRTADSCAYAALKLILETMNI